MANYRNILVYILYLSIPSRFFSQDTVFLKSGFKLIVIVKEINSRDIKYFKCDKPKGLSYYEALKNINSIHYLTGQIDSIMQLNPSDIKPIADDNKLYVKAPKMMYNSKKINDTKLFSLINSYSAETIKNELLLDFSEIKKIKSKRVPRGVFAVIFGSLLFESPALFWQGFGPRDPIYYLIPATLAASFGTSIVFFMKYRKRETLKRVQLSKRYNEGL